MLYAASDFTQQLNPLNSTLASTLVALIPLALLLVLLAVFRLTAWLVVTIGAIVTIVMAITIWHAPAGPTLEVWLLGAATGIWSIDWIVFWGVVIYNVLHETGAFEGLKRWLVTQASADVRVQAILLAWALGALLEGLVGFGYPWAVIAPILVGLGVVEIDAIRVAAIGNNAPVSYGALGTPIIGLAAVTGVPLLSLSASVGRIVAIVALLPPWILIYLVAGTPRPAGDLAAAGGGLPGLRRRPVPDLAVARALPARRHRRAGLLRRAAVAAEVLETRRDPRLRRRPGQHGSRARGRRATVAGSVGTLRGGGPAGGGPSAVGPGRRRAPGERDRWAVRPGMAAAGGGPRTGPATRPGRCARRSPGWSRSASWS